MPGLRCSTFKKKSVPGWVEYQWLPFAWKEENEKDPRAKEDKVKDSKSTSGREVDWLRTVPGLGTVLCVCQNVHVS